ncbi:tetratricopeptide repeat protein [Methylobacillus sp.]|uniref:tetratricopeptide repeat protein n=1 Tax=Methylobacillus sp. TaxID=56818 RepID=UPI002FE0C132
MTYCDRYNHLLSTESSLAAERYQAGIDLLLSIWPTAGETLDQAIDADPEFALALAARARLHAVHSEVTQAKAKIARAAELVAKKGSERERSHVAVLAHIINGQAATALAGAMTHTDLWPNDVLIMSLMLGAFGLLAFSGRADHNQARVDLCERHAPHFAADDWWFLTYRGWSHGENGNVRLGRELTERALELRRKNANAAHALAHVMYEQGASSEAEQHLADWMPEYGRSGVLYGHLAWHGALIALERGDTDQALEIYNKNIAPSANLGVPINVVSDTAAFLWRMQAYGYDVHPDLWQNAASYASGYFQQAGFPFADIHMAIIAAATGDKSALLAREKKLSEMVNSGALVAGPVVPAICRSVLAFAEENYAESARILEPVAQDAVRLGGSGAQQEIVEDTLLVALMRCGEAAKAKALLEERLGRRPSPRDSRWLLTVQAH